jgi:hypothetical protein
MLGSQIAEGKGKRTGRRIIATKPVLQVEASVEEQSTLLGIQGTNIVTYHATIKPDGSLDGQGEGAFATPEGEIVTWQGNGVGRFVEGGAMQYCGSVSFTTSSKKFLKLNGVSGVFQWSIDAEGNTHSQIFEMAPAGVTTKATKGAGA